VCGGVRAVLSMGGLEDCYWWEPPARSASAQKLNTSNISSSVLWASALCKYLQDG